MDTKLKNTNESGELKPAGGKGRLRTLYGLSWLVAAVSGAACGILGSLAVCMAAMMDLESYLEGGGEKEWTENNSWFVNIPDMNVFSDKLVSLIVWAVAAAVVFAAAVVVLCVLTGRFGRNEDGTIHLNRFDRLWSELHIAGVCGFATAAVALCAPMVKLFSMIYWTEAFVPTVKDDHCFGPSNTFIIRLCIAGMAAAILLTVLCFLPLVKKLKAHKFWEKSLIGGIVIWVYRKIKGVVLAIKRGYKESGDTLTKILLVLIGGAVLSATWLGLPVVIVLILIFVPKIVKKFTAIKGGVEEVKGGNLTYEIPVEEDAQGVRGELDRLAADINAISQASNLAVQNELKNQRMKTELISNVSHDLKTPLTSMVSYIDLLKTEGLDSPNAEEYLSIIDEKTQRLRVLTEELFEAAKASSGAIPVNMEDIDIGALVSQSLAEMDGRLEQRRLSVIVRNDLAEGAKVRADGQLLWRVVENLLSNVSKYALEGSRVYINLSEAARGEGYAQSSGENSAKPDAVLLEVKNISASELNISADELMERFTRGDASRNTEGSGLGLAIAKDLTRLMNGEFRLTVDGDLFKAGVLLEAV